MFVANHSEKDQESEETHNANGPPCEPGKSGEREQCLRQSVAEYGEREYETESNEDAKFRQPHHEARLLPDEACGVDPRYAGGSECGQGLQIAAVQSAAVSARKIAVF